MIRRFAGSALLIPLLALTVQAGAALAQGSCTREYPAIEAPLQLADFEIVDTLREDLDGDGVRDLVLLVDQGPESLDRDPDHRYAGYRIDYHEGPSMVPTPLFVTGPTVRARTRGMRTGDFDGDGQTDLLVLRFFGNTYAPMRLDLYWGQPDGTFVSEAATFATSIQYRPSPAVGDFDGDGRDELGLSARGYVGFFDVDRKTGAWTLRESAAHVSMGNLVALDFDLDGDDDLFGTIERRKTIFRFLGDPLQPLSVYQWDTVDFEPRGALLLFDADGQAPEEILVGGPESSSLTSARVRALSARKGIPAYVAVWETDFPEGVGTWRPWNFGDDEHEDLILEFRYSSFVSVLDDSWWSAQIHGFQAAMGRGTQAPLFGPRSLSAARLIDQRDLDGDGLADAILANSPYRLGLLWARSIDGVAFEDPQRFYPHPGVPTEGFHAGDLNEDGTLDLLAPSSSTAYALLGDGKGGFEVSDEFPFVWSPDLVYLRDMDSDGHLDVIYTSEALLFMGVIGIAYGLGDGTFEPVERVPIGLGYAYTLDFGDLDGDGDDDVLVDRRWPLYVEQRSWRVGTRELSSDLRPHLVRLTDLDADGVEDVVFAAVNDEETVGSLNWKQTRPDKEFGPRQVLMEWDVSLLDLETFLHADLDADGTEDLFLEFDGGPFQRFVSLQGLGQGRFRTLWSGDVPFGHADALVDFDLDGFKDLVSLSPGLRYWPGDGSGRFRLEHQQAWYLERRAVLGDFLGDERPDALAGFQLGHDAPQLGISVNRSRVLPEDSAPPKAEIWLHPLTYDLDSDPPGFDDEWRVVTTIEDECDASPRVLERRLELAPVDLSTPVNFRVSNTEEVRIYEDPVSGQLHVMLLGPNESAIRQTFAQALTLEGFPIARVATLRLVARDRRGPSPDESGDGATVPAFFRLGWSYRLHEGQLRAVAVSRPSADITFVARGEDRLGQQDQASVSLRETVRAHCKPGLVVPGLCANAAE